ncbi:hypothetical protein [Nocardia sp. CDC160]|uniref:hypothetical protein n=1 Tax=Nocardia sp. CDC160 TaxID=3112166 RepID=UPI002DBEEE3A|nr:hypothetical protein [Nocardia sp. CDC160]MEC3918749.1 hypothetical protein [Nocardia sp. CDC160]
MVVLLGFCTTIVLSRSELDHMVSSVDQFQRSAVPGTRDLRLDADHDYVGYFEYADARTSVDFPAEFSIHTVEGGTYRLTTEGDSGVTVAVGPPISQGLWLSTLPMLIGIGLGIAIALTTFGRRRRFRRRITKETAHVVGTGQ